MNLLPCPMCGDAEGSERRDDEQHLPPTMKGPGALITVTIRHWCPKVPGCVQAYREVRGRDHASAEAQWNHRPKVLSIVQSRKAQP